MSTVLKVGSDKEYTTIQAAINAAKTIEGQVVIEIDGGEYNEKDINFSAKKYVVDGVTYVGGIEFKAAEGAEVVINGNFVGSAVSDFKGITFDGLTINNVDGKYSGYYAAIYFADGYASKTASDIVIQNCNITSTTSLGTSIAVAFAYSTVVDGVIVSNNTLNAECAIYGGDGNLYNDITISGNTMNGSKTMANYTYWGGVYIFKAGENVVIENNTISGSAFKAINIRNGEGVVVVDNTVVDCQGEITVTDGSVVSGNTIDGVELTFPLYEGNDILAYGGIAGENGDYAVINNTAYIVGTNAFGSFVDALLNVTAETTKIEVAGNITENGPASNIEVALSGNLEIVCSNGNAADIDWNSNKKVSFVRAEGAEGEITLSLNNIDWALGNSAMIYFGDLDSSKAIDVVMDATSRIEAYLVRVGTDSTLDMVPGAQMTVTREVLRIEGTLNAVGAEDFVAEDAAVEDRQLKTAYTRVIAGGELNLTDTYMSSYSQFIAYGDVNMDNARMDIGLKVDGEWGTNPASNQTGWAVFDTGSNVNLDNNSLMVIGGAKGSYGLTVNSDATFTISNGSEAELSFGITNNGTIALNDGILKVGTNFNPAITGTDHKLDFVNNDTVNINGGKFVAGEVTNNGTFNVSGESTLNIGTLNGSVTVADAKLTESVINKGSVNFKGENTYSGDFNANYVFVGDWANDSYTGSVDFGTDSSVKVGGQMIIGYDYSAMGSNNVVFGDVTGEVVTDKVFTAADVSVRRDGTLTIANTTGNNKINTMNVMGQVIIDNAKLSGEAQIGSGADYNAEMIVRNGAEVNLGGSSNSVVILGKSTKGTLTVDNATLNINRCGAGAGYKVPADTFVIGYNGGAGYLNAVNGAVVNAKYNVQVNADSQISVADSNLTVVGTLTNNGTVTVSGNSTVNITTLSGTVLRFEDAILATSSTIGGRAFSFGDLTITETGSLNVKQINIYGDALIKSGATLISPTTIVDNYLKIEDDATLNVKYFNVDGTADVEGTVNVTNDSRSNYSTLVRDGGIVNVGSTGSIVIDTFSGQVLAGGTLNVNGGTVNVTKYNDGRAGKLKNEGNINVSVGSNVYVSVLEGSGTITIDATGWTGFSKVIDVDSSTFSGNFEVIGNENAYLIFGEDGDVIVSTASAKTVYVNSAWTGYTYGELVEGDLYYGINAFDSLLDYTAAENTEELVIAGGNYSGIAGDFSNKTSVIKSDIKSVAAYGDVTVDLGNLVFATDYAGTVEISGNYETTDYIRYTGTWGVDWTELQNGHIRFVGGDDTTFAIDGNFTSAENIQFIGGSAVISADSNIVVGNAHYGQYLINGADVVNYGSMSLDLDAFNGSAMNILGNGSLTISGADASLYINMKDGGASNKDINVTKGSLIIEDGASAVVTGAVTVAANGTVAVNGGNLEAVVIDNNGILDISGGSLTADKVSGSGSFNINGAVDAEGNAVATELNIGSLQQNIYANKNSDKTVVLTGDVNMPTWNYYFRVYGDAVIDGLNINKDYIGATVSASGMLNLYGDTLITGDTVMNLNALQVTNSGTIDKGVVINTANFNAFDMGAANDGTVVDAVFTVKGTLNTVSFIVTNDY